MKIVSKHRGPRIVSTTRDREIDPAEIAKALGAEPMPDEDALRLRLLHPNPLRR